jgi:hypothetical protein
MQDTSSNLVLASPVLVCASLPVVHIECKPVTVMLRHGVNGDRQPGKRYIWCNQYQKVG